MKTKHTFAIFYTTILIAVTVWSLLDTFVIADKIAVVDDTLANTGIYADLENEDSSGSNSDSAMDGDSPSSNSDSVLDEDSSSSSSDGVLGGESDSSSQAPTITDYSYQDSNIQITIETIRAYNTDIYVADVLVSDVAYLKTALAVNQRPKCTTYSRVMWATHMRVKCAKTIDAIVI
jgi:hypothetical protein